MKKNDWALIISVLIYSILFYDQYAGINFLLFNLAIVGLLIYRDKNVLKSRVWLSVAAGAIISSFFIFMYDSVLAIWANLFSLFILSALSISTKTSFLTSIFLTICSTGSSCVFMFIDWVKRKSREVSGNYARPFYVKLFLLIIPFLIAILFFFFYQTSNPLFYDFTKNINLDFISIAWIFFTLGGLLLMYGFFHNNIMPSVYRVDENASLVLTPEIASRKNFLNGLMRNDTENLSGIILFCMLNILLLMVNTLDINYFLFNGKLPKGIGYKAFVHDGIGTLITSIVVAISIILFYFRGELNFYERSKWIKRMAFIWIAQNAFMIFSTAYRNLIYIEESGISYKKIGVYVYLILTFIGLVTTFIKVLKLKTNWYLFRVNASVFYYFLVLGCVPNWDVIVTDFNIKKHDVEHKQLEKYLLLDLSYKNLPQLLSLPDSVSSKEDFNARDYYNFSRGTYYYNFKSGLAKKLYDFLEEYPKLEWQSTCLEKTRVYNELMAMRNNIQSLEFQNAYIKTLEPIQIFAEIKSLSIENSMQFNLSELKAFPKLEKLKLMNCQLDSLDKFPALNNLKDLNLSGNGSTDISGLSKLTSLETLDLSGYNASHIKSYAPLLSLVHLKHLIIRDITPEGLETMKHTFPDVQIDAKTYNPNSAE